MSHPYEFTKHRLSKVGVRLCVGAAGELQCTNCHTVETRTALAARQLTVAGVNVYPGQPVHFVVTDAKAGGRSRRVQAEAVEALSAYDVGEYVKLLNDAADEVLSIAHHGANLRRG